MIIVTGLELRAGSRILLSETTLRVQPGDRIGLVGRNGAGKTTTLRYSPVKRSPTPVRWSVVARWVICRRTHAPVICLSLPETGFSPPVAWTVCSPR